MRPYQLECLEELDRSIAEGRRRHRIDMFCGLGKSRIIRSKVLMTRGIRFVVMSNLSLVRQFCASELAGKRYMVFCSLEDTQGVEAATTDVADARAFLSGGEGIVAVTYHSLPKLLEAVEKVDFCFCDESHNVNRPTNRYILTSEVFDHIVFLSATPGDEGEEVFRYTYSDALANDPPYSQDLRLHAGLHTDGDDDNIASMLNTAVITGNMRILSFHNNVNGEDPDSVLNFKKRCEAHIPFARAKGLKLTVLAMSADTPQEERTRMLQQLDNTPDDELCVLCSCQTISEGVDTRKCNFVAFIAAVRNYAQIVQRLGRGVRIQPGRPPATIFVPFFVDRAEIPVNATKEEVDAYLRTAYARGNPLFDFYAAIKEGDPELVDLLLDIYRGPQAERLGHYERLIGRQERMSLEDAVERVTGEKTADVAGAVQRSQRSVEVHPREGPVQQHVGSAAVEGSIVEMEPDAWVPVRGAVEETPRKNRVVYSALSPFLLDLHFDDALGTAVIAYEMRPERIDEIIQKMHVFYAEYGEPKRRGVLENEDWLATWMVRQRMNKKKGLNAELCARVEREFPWWSWDPLAEAFERTITQMHAFYALYGEPKHGGVRENEKILAKWVSHRRDDKKNIRAVELCSRIDIEFPWWRWDPLADALERTISQMHAFYAEHGEPRQKGVRGNEAFLANWIRTIRQNKKKGLNTELCARIEHEFPWWIWDPWVDAFEGTLTQMRVFYAEHGEPKQKGIRENEAFLANWISNQRSDKKKGLNPELCSRIEREFPWWSWDPLVDAFERYIAQIHAFYAEHGEPKFKGVRGNEASLAIWISIQRQNKKKGLNPDLSVRIEREFPWWSWDPLVDAFERTLTQIHAFYAEHGEPKQGGVRENESSLARWMCVQRRNKHKGLNSELCARIEREFPWWSWDPLNKALEKTIKQMHVFYGAHGEPKGRGVRENEHKLARWIGTQRVNKKKDLNPELCARVEREFPWWRWSARAETDNSVDMSPEEPDDVSTSKTKMPTIYFNIHFKKSTDDASDMSEEPGTIEGEDTEVEEEPDDLTDSEASLEPKRKRDGLDELTKEELLEKLRKRQARGYTAPNPAAKDEINARFAAALPADGLVVFLDHVDFKTARACLAQGVPASAMVIPQRDPATFAQMRLDTVFGASVREGDFNAVFESLQTPIRGVYADFTGALKCGLDFVAVCERVQFTPGAVVAVTITLRNPEGNDSYVNSDVETLSSAMADIGLRSLKVAGERVAPIAYGVGQPMVTVFKMA